MGNTYTNKPNITQLEGPSRYDSQSFIVTLNENANKNGEVNIPTFGSFNRHVAEINGTYYVSYDNNSYVHIVKSTDKGHTWNDLYSPNGHECILAPVIDIDKKGRLHVIWEDLHGKGHYMRFSGEPLKLDIDKEAGSCNTKYSMIYSNVDDVLYWSRREGMDLYIVKLDTEGNIISKTCLVLGVGKWGNGEEHWDAHYHSMYTDGKGRLHLIYCPHVWPDSSDATKYIRRKVLYMYSDDQGSTWRRADSRIIELPFNANDFINGGTEISTEEYGYTTAILANLKHVHILYQTRNSPNDYLEKYIRLSRDTGKIEKRYVIEGLSLHASIIEDKKSDTLYIFGECNSVPILYASYNNGDSWEIISQINYKPFEGGIYLAATACPTVTEDESIIGITTNFDRGTNAIREVLFVKYNIDKICKSNKKE